MEKHSRGEGLGEGNKRERVQETKGWRSRPVHHGGSHATQPQHVVVVILVTAFPGLPRPDPTSTNTSTHRSLKETTTDQSSASATSAQVSVHTKVAPAVARTPAALPEGVVRGTMRERGVLIPDIAEHVDAVCAREKRHADRMHGCVAPALPSSHSRVANQGVSLCISGGRGDIPRSRNRRCSRGTRKTSSRPRRAKSPYRQSQSCSKLFRVRRVNGIGEPLAPALIRGAQWEDVQWQRL
jgi:hypothetical protein